jgi:hypothetical protein
MEWIKKIIYPLIGREYFVSTDYATSLTLGDYNTRVQGYRKKGITYIENITQWK